MPSQRRATGWISTDKTFNDASKNKNPKALKQTSMLGFLRSISKRSKDSKEDDTSRSKKRKLDACVNSASNTSKKRQKDTVTKFTSRGLLELPNESDSNSLCTLGTRASTPIVLLDDKSPQEQLTFCTGTSSSQIFFKNLPELPSPACKFNKLHGTDAASSPDLDKKPTKSLVTPRRASRDASSQIYTNLIDVLTSPAVIPSSQAEEMGILFSPSRNLPDCGFAPSQSPVQGAVSPKFEDDMAEGVVPSSQSQYLLPYEASPIRPRWIPNEINANDELVPSSQSQIGIDISLLQAHSMELREKQSIQGRATIYRDLQESGALEFPKLIPLQGLKSSFANVSEPEVAEDKDFLENPIVGNLHPDTSVELNKANEDSQSNTVEKTCPQEFIEFFDHLGSLDSQIQEALVSEKRPIQEKENEETPGDHLSVNQEVLAAAKPKAYECKGSPIENQGNALPIPTSPSMSQSQSQSNHESQYTYMEKTCPAFLAEFFEISERGLGSLRDIITCSDINSVKALTTHFKPDYTENDLDSQRGQDLSLSASGPASRS